MKPYHSIDKDLSTLVPGLIDYISNISVGLNDYFIRLDEQELQASVPNLVSVFSELNLNINGACLFTAYPIEIVAPAACQVAIIPLRNFSNMSLVEHQLVEGAPIYTNSINGIKYHLTSDATEISSIPFEADKIYLVDKDVCHSYHYVGLPYYGTFMLLSFSEDLSSYFI